MPPDIPQLSAAILSAVMWFRICVVANSEFHPIPGAADLSVMAFHNIRVIIVANQQTHEFLSFTFAAIQIRE